MALIIKRKSGSANSNNGNNVATWYRLQIRPTDAPGTLYRLPAKCFVTHAIVKSGTAAVIEVIATDVAAAVTIIVPSAPYIINEIETFAPTIYIPNATFVGLRGELDGQTSVDIFYTTTTI